MRSEPLYAFSSAMTALVPVILCGGTGTRLWPLSRAIYPKQYWALAGDGDDTLLQQTHQRLEGIAGGDPAEADGAHTARGEDTLLLVLAADP